MELRQDQPETQSWGAIVEQNDASLAFSPHRILLQEQGEKCRNIFECKSDLLCCGDKTCQKSCDDNLQSATKSLNDLCIEHYECVENYLCCPSANKVSKVCSVSDTGICHTINTAKTIVGGETVKHTSYEEYIERMRREEHLRHPGLITVQQQPIQHIQHKPKEPVTADGYAHAYVDSHAYADSHNGVYHQDGMHHGQLSHSAYGDENDDKDTLYAVFFTILVLALLLFACGVCAYFFGKRNSYQDPTQDMSQRSMQTSPRRSGRSPMPSPNRSPRRSPQRSPQRSPRKNQEYAFGFQQQRKILNKLQTDDGENQSQVALDQDKDKAGADDAGNQN